VLLTDTTMRDAHQSLFATRMRTTDMAVIAPMRACCRAVLAGMLGRRDLRRRHALPERRSVGAAASAARGAPNVLFQMLLRASNAVGYTNYSDNVVKFFVQQAAAGGVDVFRVFDSLNWVENMRVAMDAVIDSGAICEGTICYTGDLFDRRVPSTTWPTTSKMAKELERPARTCSASRTWPALPPACRESAGARC
jgi:pyruvate carboxylase